jgi:hypothetical protein
VRRLAPLLFLVALLVPAAAAAQPAAPVAAGPRPAPVDPTTTHLPLTGGAVRTAAAPGNRTVLETAPRATSRYETLGVTWDPAADRSDPATPLVEVRTRTDGAWSAWTDVPGSEGADGNPGAEGGPAVRGGTDPLWVGPSDGVQVRVTAAPGGTLPSGLRAELIDPGRSPYDAVAGGAGDAAVRPAAAGRPAIVTRASWGANESRVREAPVEMPTIAAAVLHHTAGKNGYSRAQVPGIIRGDFAYHLSRGWNDIGYNVLVDRFGRVWEGRGGGLDKAILGAHTGGFNTTTFGVSVLGNLDVARPSPATVEAIARVMAWKLDLYHRDPLGTTVLTARGASGTTSRYEDGTRVRMPTIFGHRNVGQTACPGRYLYPALPAIRKRAEAIMKAALLEPRLTPAERVYRTGGATVSALPLANQTWRLTIREACSGGVVTSVGGRSQRRNRFSVTWSGRDRTGAWVRPGRYLLELTASSAAGTARPYRAAVVIVPPDPVPSPTGPAATGAGTYVPVTPATLLDTRGGVAPLGPDGRVDLPVLGRAGIPASGVTSVVLEAVSVCATRNTALTLYPTGQAMWGTQSVHVPVPLTRSAAAVVPVGAGGRVSVRNDLGVSDVVVDVLGYHTTDPDPARAGAGLVPARARLYDSRTSGGALQAGETRTIALPDVAGVPAAAMRAQLLDVTVVEPAAAGTLQVFPGTSAAATTTVAARLHHQAGGAHDERMPVAVSGGRLTLRASAATHVIVDTAGWYPAAPGTGQAFTAIPPVRLLDTRTSGSGYLAAGGSRRVRVTGVGGVPADAAAVLVNVIGIQPHGTARITAWPMGRDGETVTAVRLVRNDVRGNLALVPVGSSGGILVGTPDAAAKVVVDLVGWYR